MNIYEAKCEYSCGVNGFDAEFSQASDEKEALAERDRAEKAAMAARELGCQSRWGKSTTANQKAAEALVEFFRGMGRSHGVDIRAVCSTCGETEDQDLRQPLSQPYFCMGCTQEAGAL